MPLSKELATKIVNIVKADAECQKRITSSFAHLPGDATKNGQTRNLAWAGWLKVVGYDILGIDAAYKYVCAGIADAAVAAITRAALPEVLFVFAIPNNPADHWGTQVKVKAGGTYVFDWWATLDTANPVVCHEGDWKADKGGVLFANFQGYTVDPVPPTGRVQPKRGLRKAQPAQKTYVVVVGDTLSTIAKRQYGNSAQWRKIYDANRAVIGNNPDMIKVNMKLVIPA